MTSPDDFAHRLWLTPKAERAELIAARDESIRKDERSRNIQRSLDHLDELVKGIGEGAEVPTPPVMQEYERRIRHAALTEAERVVRVMATGGSRSAWGAARTAVHEAADAIRGLREGK